MDWRLIAAVVAAAGSCGLVAVGARAVLTAGPAPPQKMASAPALTFDYRFPVAAAPSLTGAAPSFPTQTSPDEASPGQASPGQASPSQAPRSPFAALDESTPSGSVFASGARGRVDGSPPLIVPPLVADKPLHARPEPRAGGYKTAALRPGNDVLPPEPAARPLVEAKRPSVVPELHTALPAAHYRGVLTSTEIARIKHNLRLTPEQEPAWPRVEAALAEMGRQQVALIRDGQEPRVSQNDWPPGRLYAVAGPLLQILRPDQKETVRRLCRSLGFDSVASML
jgi:hypothetical protein